MFNDLVINVDSNVIMFADDVTFNFSDKSVENCNLFLSNELNKANQWYCATKFLFNSDKTQTFNFSLNKDTNNKTECVF